MEDHVVLLVVPIIENDINQCYMQTTILIVVNTFYLHLHYAKHETTSDQSDVLITLLLKVHILKIFITFFQFSSPTYIVLQMCIIDGAFNFSNASLFLGKSFVHIRPYLLEVQIVVYFYYFSGINCHPIQNTKLKIKSGLCWHSTLKGLCNQVSLIPHVSIGLDKDDAYQPIKCY